METHRIKWIKGYFKIKIHKFFKIDGENNIDMEFMKKLKELNNQTKVFIDFVINIF